MMMVMMMMMIMVMITIPFIVNFMNIILMISITTLSL